MSIYENIKEYAEKTHMTIEQAKVRCDYYLKLIHDEEEARKCPRCGHESIVYESGSYEEGIGAYVYCDNPDCDFDSDITDEFDSLSPGYAFDEVLYFAVTEDMKNVDKVVGLPWKDFVEKSNQRLTV